MTRQAGFTLVELLIALAVFAVMSAMAYGGLSSMLEAREGIDRALERTTTMQRAVHRIQTDLEQAVKRPIRDAYGDPQPALILSANHELSLTRNGWRNPLSRPRSNLQRVAYRIDEDDRLVRLHWQVLDRAQDSTPAETVLLEEIDDLEWRFLDTEREWRDTWPQAGNAGASGTPTQGPTASAELPIAVELRLETPAWGELRHVFMIPGAGA